MAADRLLRFFNAADGTAVETGVGVEGEGGEGDRVESRSGTGPPDITRGTVAIAAADIGRGGRGGKIPLDGDEAEVRPATSSSSCQISSRSSPRVLVDRGGGRSATAPAAPTAGMCSVELPSMATSDVSTPALDARLVPLVNADAPLRSARRPSSPSSSPQLQLSTPPSLGPTADSEPFEYSHTAPRVYCACSGIDSDSLDARARSASLNNSPSVVSGRDGRPGRRVTY